MKEQDYDDEILAQYLLGSATEETTERLDELSIGDDAMAERLQIIENDLVDAYVNGGLSDKTLSQFESFYLASPKRREKIGFARTLLALEQRTGSVAPDAEKTSVPGPRRPGRDSFEGAPRSRFFVVPRPMWQWGFATAALVLLIAGSFLVVENLRLRDQMARTQAERAELAQRERQLQQQLSEQRSSDAETEKELAQVRDRLTQLEQAAPDRQHAKADQRDLKILAFNLAPQIRGIGQIPTLAVPAGTDYVALTVELETDAYSVFRAALKNPASGQIVWRSGNLKGSEKSKTVRVRLPAKTLSVQNYALELSGIPAHGVPEVVSSYPFRVVTQ